MRSIAFYVAVIVLYLGFFGGILLALDAAVSMKYEVKYDAFTAESDDALETMQKEIMMERISQRRNELEWQSAASIGGGIAALVIATALLFNRKRILSSKRTAQ